MQCRDKEIAINIRPLLWPDLVYMYQQRHQIFPLDSISLLTHGSPIGLSSVLDLINPRQRTYTGTVQQFKPAVRLIGQVVFRPGDRSARLSYLLPTSQSTAPVMVNLLEGLAEKAGQRGVFSLLAELDEISPAMEFFRRAGFVVYGWQRIWQIPLPETGFELSSPIWRPAREVDDLLIHNLFQSLVPPLSQAADPFHVRRLPGLVYYQDNEILAYIEYHTGRSGILLLPFIHPEVKNVDILLKNVTGSLAPVLNRPVYLAVRSYQAWLEPVLENMGAIPAEKQALLVKRLTQVQRVTVPVRSVLAETRRAETSAPLLNHIKQAPEHPGEGRSEIL